VNYNNLRVNILIYFKRKFTPVIAKLNAVMYLYSFILKIIKQGEMNKVIKKLKYADTDLISYLDIGSC